MTQTIVGIGTRKGLWLARSADRASWKLDGPHFLMSEVLSLLFDTRAGRSRLVVGFRSSHWGPSLQHSDDLGATWIEHPEGSIRFPEDTDTALKATWQLVADPHDDDVTWAGTKPQGLWRSDDASPWSSLSVASSWGAERLHWPSRWASGHDRCGPDDRPFRGTDLLIRWWEDDLSPVALAADPSLRGERNGTVGSGSR